MDDNLKKQLRFMRKLGLFLGLADNLADLSTCKRGGNACVILRPDFSEATFGYTGPPAGLPNEACLNVSKRCGCPHAEINAIMKLPGECNNYRMIVTSTPCLYCAGTIINCGRISHVLAMQTHHTLDGMSRLLEAGINVIHLDAVEARYPDELQGGEVLHEWWKTLVYPM